MKLSICVTTHNRLAFLKLLLEQLQKVSFTSFEIIVSDDSTNDETENYFRDNPLPGIRYFRNSSNLGPYQNSNACIARAKGEWIQIVNDDDQINPGYLSGITPLLDQDDIVMITGKTIIEGKNAESVTKLHQEKLNKLGLSEPGIYDGKKLIPGSLIHGNPFVFSHTIFRREAAISIGGFNSRLRYAGDFNLWLNLLRKGKCYVTDTRMGMYFVHDSNAVVNEGRWTPFSEFMYEKMYFAKDVKSYCAKEEYSAYMLEIRKEFPAALFFSAKILKREELYKSLKTLIGQYGLRPYYFSAKSIFFSLLNVLPAPVAAGTYHFFRRRKLRLSGNSLL
jgi:glycosyltransferase involved in cell wall biosynthesis